MSTTVRHSPPGQVAVLAAVVRSGVGLGDSGLGRAVADASGDGATGEGEVVFRDPVDDGTLPGPEHPGISSNIDSAVAWTTDALQRFTPTA
ncbi:hypothetical protein ASH00_08195 [Arthrobacter sp. Soil782]|uniref:hypothetical protein n=1 Tax=Arthrobacter sp. Soil782 TaxID=1736410 RepID=UPI0006F34238|nr:hypothetical protein [Arthrobacter sp. Soil782]KRF06230.1 hypothetical protein ASH00_08195 [Arthrobacter sp. Soil782]